ncbi:Zinc transporter 2 [Armadillidium vulgare]|nr:Zinc transporter 2 [Armadillidium vulgare]
MLSCFRYFQCTDEGNVPSQCPSSLCFSQEQCSCAPPLECTDDCEFVDDPFDDCKKYYYCYNDLLIEYSCSGSSCFSQSSCGCVEEKSSTMSTSTSIDTNDVNINDANNYETDMSTRMSFCR